LQNDAAGTPIEKLWSMKIALGSSWMGLIGPIGPVGIMGLTKLISPISAIGPISPIQDD